MPDKPTVTAWLQAYIQAWQTYDPAAIGALFSEDAVYCYSPYDKPLRGRAAIVASWLDGQDAPGTYTAHYEIVALEGDTAVTGGKTCYFYPDGSVETEFDNLFVLRFDRENRVCEFREWYMQQPEEA